jgi:hypothetical protein
MKPLVAFAVLGVAGIAVWKIAAAVLMPLVGALFGLLFKVALIVALVWFALWFFRRKDSGSTDTPPPAAD